MPHFEAHSRTWEWQALFLQDLYSKSGAISQQKSLFLVPPVSDGFTSPLDTYEDLLSARRRKSGPLYNLGNRNNHPSMTTGFGYELNLGADYKRMCAPHRPSAAVVAASPSAAQRASAILTTEEVETWGDVPEIGILVCSDIPGFEDRAYGGHWDASKFLSDTAAAAAAAAAAGQHWASAVDRNSDPYFHDRAALFKDRVGRVGSPSHMPVASSSSAAAAATVSPRQNASVLHFWSQNEPHSSLAHVTRGSTSFAYLELVS